jgi:biopolymer transport protein ExbB
MKFMSSLKAAGAAALFGLSTVAMSAPVNAQSFSQVLDAIRRDSSQLTAENQARLQEFRQANAEQERILNEGRAELNAVRAEANALSTEFDENENRLGELQAQLEAEAGDFAELLGQFRTAAGETMPVLTRSLSNFDPGANPVDVFGPNGRVGGLAEVAEARTLPTRQELERLPKAILMEMVAQSEVTEFTATVANSGDDNANAEQTITRIGTFTAAINDGTRFIEVTEGQGGDTFLREFPVQPGGNFRGAMGSLIAAGPDAVVRAPIDPSKGDLFALFENVPNLNDRIEDGGPVGMVIMVLAAVGVLLGLYKIVTLFLLGGSMKSTAKSKTAGKGNPLARVFEVYEQNRNEDVETLELKLDEQILKETPKIERFNDIIKVLAAVAPLLGLLGTVIGMIITFTQITLYGAGDPQIMAGGISTALMTTVFGLVAAIPLILLHAIASGAARGAQQTLDEQAAGLVAERAEEIGRSGRPVS